MQEFLPNRLNEAPSVFKGCSWEELALLATVSFLVSLAISILLVLLGLNWLVMFALVTLFTSFGVYFGAVIMARLKRGKPPGFYKIKIHVLMQKYGFKQRTSIVVSRYWDVGGQ